MSNQHTTLLSFINFFKIEFGLIWIEEEKSFDTHGGGYSNTQYENILSLCSIDFNIYEIENFFLKISNHYFNLNKKDKRVKNLNKLVKRVKSTIKRSSVKYNLEEYTYDLYEIDLYKFLKSEENLSCVIDLGMAGYVHNIITSVANVLEEHKLKIKNASDSSV